MPAEHDGDAGRLAVAQTQDYGEKDGGGGPATPGAAGWAGALVGRTVGSYRVVRPLGQGGMGVVFEAVHEGIGQRAAVKVLNPLLGADPRLVSRFWSEARAVSRVSHPGLVKIFDFGQLPDGTLYLLMEYLEGETLRARLDRGRLGTSAALRVARQLGAALAAAHERGIAHRDLKPDNVFMVPDEEAAGGERAKVLDFGLAKVLDSRERGGVGTGHATGSGMIMGTPRYMAPEQCRGLGQADGQADVYALGVLLFEALSGHGPFEAEAPGDLLAMHLMKEAPPLRAPGAPSEVVRLVAEMLTKDPAARPTMARVTAELGRLDGRQSGAVLAGPSPGTRGRPLAWLLLVAGLCLVGALGVYATRRATGGLSRSTAPVPGPLAPAPAASAPGPSPLAPAPAVSAPAPAAPAAAVPKAAVTTVPPPAPGASRPRPAVAEPRRTRPAPAEVRPGPAAAPTPAAAPPSRPPPPREDEDVVVPAVR